jgi:hypothetical protein
MTIAVGGGAIPDLDRMASLLAVALSRGRRGGAVIDSGPSQAFQTDLRLITVPAGLPLAADDPLVLACGVALQCAPSKEDAVRLRWWELPRRQRGALAWAEGEAAARWVSETWPGLATTIGALFHTGRRLRQRPGAAHVLLSFGDALPSDEGYDGAYARADVAKAVDEQRRAGTLVSHVAVAAVEAARLDEMFGPGGWAPATGPTDLAPVLATVAHTLRRPM